MFRITQQQVLKTRITGQVVNTARNSINHSIRFNSVAIERAPSSTTSTDNSLSFTNTIKNVANLQNSLPNQKRSGRKNNKAKYSRDDHVNPSSPWFKQISAFKDVVTRMTSTQDASTQMHFFESFKLAMKYYDDLKGTPDFNAYLVSILVYALHTGLRSNRQQLTRLSKKPDYDARSFNTDMNELIKKSLQTITTDILNEVVQINESGAMHLLTSLKELKLYQEAIRVWTASMEIQSLKNTFIRPRVVGVLLPVMYNSGTKFQDLEDLFEESKAISAHPHLLSGMIKTCLAAGEHQKALELFDELCNYESPDTAYTALTDVHLSFIGDCKDISIASTFFEKAINRDMPYKLILHVNSVKQFLDNIWQQEHDFDHVATMWRQATTFYGRNMHHGVSSSLNNTFFDIFFEKYAQDKAAGLTKLNDIIAIYNSIKPIDEPFFNIIISKCSVWKDLDIINTLYSAYEMYGLKKTQVSRRIYLKSLGSIKYIPDEVILKSWYDLILHNDSEGYKYIANADWAALRDATFAADEDRAELYAKIFKKYQWFCRDSNQFRKMLNVAKLFPVMEPYMGNLEAIDADVVEVPHFRNMQARNFYEG